MKIRNSMYWIVLLLIVIPLLLFTVIISNVYSDELEDVVTDSLQVVANAQMEEMRGFCEQQRSFLQMLGSMEMAREALKGELDDSALGYFNEVLLAQVMTTSYFKSICLVDENLRVAACSENHDFYAEDGIDILIGSRNGRDFYISNIVEDTSGERSLVAIYFIEESNEVIGYALMEIRLDFYEKMRKNSELWNEATFYLLDGEQQIISAGTSDEDRNAFISNDKDREDYKKKYNQIDFEKNPQGSFRYDYNGEKYITYYSNVEFTDWRIMLSVNTEHYRPGRTIYTAFIFFLVIFCIVLSVCISRFVSTRIVKPIRRISDTLEKIREENDYTLRVNVKNNDELAILADGVNRLIDFVETENLYKQQQQRILEERADLDALTKVMNKERISAYLEEAIERCKVAGTSLAVIFVDIDDFKAFNTNYGHAVGDQVLLFLTSMLAKGIDGTVGRVGGDEFLVVVENKESVQTLEACLNDVTERLESYFVVRGTGTRIAVSCCMGAVWVDFSEEKNQTLTAEKLIELSDSAMYDVKNNGKRGYTIIYNN